MQENSCDKRKYKPYRKKENENLVFKKYKCSREIYQNYVREE